ncbi:MAG TPA: hypothetical protein VMN37_09195 [Gemmatimonadales bacterium]|nr:hypothetical protein [Gemmatimonadales bacterium]
MIAAHGAAPDRDGFGATYEDLRRRVLTGATVPGTGGLLLCLREGLAAWIARGAVGAAPVAPAGHHPERWAAARVANEIHAAVVRVLASMALDRVKETPP